MISAMSVSEQCDLSGQRIVVTGASSGIGLELTRVLAIRGAEVIMACRNPQKTKQVIQILAQNLNEDQVKRLIFEECDLSLIQNVFAFCERLKEVAIPINKIFLNGGVFSIPFQLTSENLEYTYTANYLGHFLILRALLNAKLLAEDAHIIGTMSEGGYQYPFAKANFKFLSKPKDTNRIERLLCRFTASPNSKVMMLLMMEYFNRKIKSQLLPHAQFNCADPGHTLTDNVNQMGTIMKMVAPIYSPLFLHSVEHGASGLMWLATSEEAKRLNGVVLKGLKQVSIPDRSKNPSLSDECWKVSEKIIEAILSYPIEKVCVA